MQIPLRKTNVSFCMKCIYIFFLLLLFNPGFVKKTQATEVRQKYILIISSYSEEVTWATFTGNEIAARLKSEYPDAWVYVDYLSADNTYTRNGLLAKARAIFQPAGGKSAGSSATSFDVNSGYVFKTDEQYKPVMLVLIGDEMWSLYRSVAKDMGSWKDIPVVLCGVNDSIDNVPYYPQLGEKFETLIPLTESGCWKSAKDQMRYEINMTGVMQVLPLQENLKLIKTLVPDIKHITFVDKRYYTTEYAVRRLKKEIENFDPDIHFSVRYTNWMNVDTILNEMLLAKKGEVYLTYSWNLKSRYSGYTYQQVDSLFKDSKTPVFSLTYRKWENARILGGYYVSPEEYADQTFAVVKRILAGEPVDAVPLKYIKGGKYYLNQTAVLKYGLKSEAKNLEQAIRENIPFTFYERNEKGIALSAIFLVLVTGITIVFIRRRIHIKQLRRSLMEYKQLYKELQLIYAHLPIDFALYDKKGCKIGRVIKAQQPSSQNLLQNILPFHIFQNHFLDEFQKKRLKNGQIISCEIPASRLREVSPYKLEENTIFELIIKPLINVNYKSSCYIAIIANKTGETKEREERERFESLFHFASDFTKVGIAYYDPQDGKGFASRAWYTNLNEPIRDRIIPAYQHVFPEGREFLTDSRRKIKEGMSVSCLGDIQVFSEDGQVHWIRQFFFRYEDRSPDKKVLLVELNFNVDQQKATEVELIEAKEKAEKVNREKEEFLANISHEIRTPLNAIVGFCSLLVNNEVENDRIELGNIVRRNSENLMELITNILDLAKIDAGRGKFVLSETDINEVYERVINYGKKEIKNRPLELCWIEREEKCLLFTDESRLQQVLFHLLSNALKFTEKGCITLGYKRRNDVYYFYVTDTGGGIEEKEQENVFRRFVKINNFAQGSGLGLPLCESIVKNLGGQIGLISALGQGTTFWFTLPAEGNISS